LAWLYSNVIKKVCYRVLSIGAKPFLYIVYTRLKGGILVPKTWYTKAIDCCQGVYMKTFCIAGPVNKDKHYFVPHRLNEPELMLLIEQEKYFILHAPRQTGKTTAIRGFVEQLNKQEIYKTLYINIEVAQASRSTYLEGIRSIMEQFREAVFTTFGESDPGFLYLKKLFSEQRIISGNEIYNFLTFWAQQSDKPLIIFMDEIDSLVGDTLISVLRQIRAGYTNRPDNFPQSICLFGVRDVRDYRIYSPETGNIVLGGSAFNIKAESIVLPDFSFEQVQDLYHQHTQATGQEFTLDAVEYAFYLTQGQPWLVNALAYQACFRDVTDRTVPITKEIIEKSKEVLIKRCDTHLDALIDKLSEPRVKAVIEALLLGTMEPIAFLSDVVQYVTDLGFISRTSKNIQIANPIYQEIFPRALVVDTQRTIHQETVWYVKPDGLLDMQKLLEKFTQFFRENSEVWLEQFDYKEAGPHLLLMAFLQRIINGGGSIHREYALGRGRVDLLILWKTQRIVIELKLWKSKMTISDGVDQIVGYMDTNNSTEGHLVVFDRRITRTWEQKIYHHVTQEQNKKIDIWGM
jgi:hypothetical protein